jgi:hypothetical protein
MGGDSLPGKASRKYQGELMRFNKSLNKPLKNIKSILPNEYNAEIIVDEFEKYYPLMWKDMNERYENYSAKDKVLIKHGKKIRYRPLKARQYILKLPQVKNWLSDGGRKNHKIEFNMETQKENIAILDSKKSKSILKYETKVANNTLGIQEVEPLYVDVFISAYHKTGTTTEDKIEILNELKKFNTNKTIEFFYKLNDAERNNQIRRMAFLHLQSIGKYVKLRKNFKGKKKDYVVEKSDFDMTPEDLWSRIEKDSIQNKKEYDYFISHSIKNRNEVLSTMKSLNNQNFIVYCDWTNDNDFLKRKLVSEYTKMVLKKRLDQSERILLIESEHSMKSEWVEFELEYFESLGKSIYYIEIDNTTDERLKKYSKLEYDFDKKFIQSIEDLK